MTYQETVAMTTQHKAFHGTSQRHVLNRARLQGQSGAVHLSGLLRIVTQREGQEHIITSKGPKVKNMKVAIKKANY